MGTVVAQDIFQSKLDAIFISMEGVTGIADDMVIAGKNEMEHNRNFLAFMEKCMENNLTLNLEKIQFKQTQVSFYGECWSPDPKKIQALKHMEFPPDKETMRSFLGMINYLNRYSALSTHLASPLSALITPGYRLQAREGSSGELQPTEDGNFQHEGTSVLRCQC